jgi:hypothetical protein
MFLESVRLSGFSNSNLYGSQPLNLQLCLIFLMDTRVFGIRLCFFFWWLVCSQASNLRDHFHRTTTPKRFCSRARLVHLMDTAAFLICNIQLDRAAIHGAIYRLLCMAENTERQTLKMSKSKSNYERACHSDLVIS